MVSVVLLLGSCVPVVENATKITRPQEPTDLRVTGTTDTSTVLEETAVTLTAIATGGTPPYVFRWDLNEGPVDLALTDVTLDTLTSEPLSTPGRYVFRVIATDSDGFNATDFVAVEVLQAVAATAPALAVVGEPVELSATIEADVQNVALEWTVLRGTASLDNPTSVNPMLVTTTGETVEVLLTVTLPSTGDAPVITTRSFEIVSIDDLRPQVLIETNFGDITLELEGELAPLHTANFLLHVDDGFYDGLLFHRVVCSPANTDECEPFIIQGGGFKRVDGELEQQDATRDPVPSEADNGLSNGTVNSVTLALSGGDPNSGTTQFFINLADNSFLDNQGFTVFGMVVGGVDVVDAILALETEENPFAPPGEVSLPVEDVIMERVSRVSP